MSTFNPRPVGALVGRLLLVLAAGQLLPALCSLIYAERQTALAFVASAAVTAACGGALVLFGRQGEIYRREGVLIVASSWILASFFGALPYLFTGTLSSPIDAVFEAASGFSTTGATVLPAISAADRGVLFWRSFTQWMGGMGIIVLFVALLSELGPGARFLYKLEVPGPTAESLKPRIRDTASVLWRIYLVLTLVETALLMLCGLGLYDALTHTFSTLSTGGFSPLDDSVAGIPSVWAQAVIIAFMVLAGGNFSLYYGIWLGRGWQIFRDLEFRFYLLIMATVSMVIVLDLAAHAPEATPRPWLDSVFQVVSITTTTGFATADFEQWPHLSRLLLVALMFMGGCAGSTSGSMKVMRMLIGLKAAWREVRLTFSPSTVIAVQVGRNAVPEAVVRSVAGFFILFLTTWGIGTLLIAIGDHSLVTAATASIAVLGNIGPGLDAVGPTENFAFFSGWHKLLMVVMMWIGRLEVYSILALATLAFWRR